MADKITLRVVTPSRLLLEQEVDEVTVQGPLGQLGILPDHISFLTTLDIGELSYKGSGATSGSIALSGGYAEVLDNVMTVLANAAEFSADIDVERARRASSRAEEKLAELSYDDPDYEETEQALRRAQTRLALGYRTSS